jgi:hypothetical protein
MILEIRTSDDGGGGSDLFCRLVCLSTQTESFVETSLSSDRVFDCNNEAENGFRLCRAGFV